MFVDYRRAYWILFAGIGILFGIRAAASLAARGPTDLPTVVSLLAAATIVLAAGFAVRDPESAGGPTGPTPLFLLVVAAFVLLLVGVLGDLLGW